VHIWSTQRPLVERFWSLAEAVERAEPFSSGEPVGAVRHVLDILEALDAGRSGGVVAPSTRGFLMDLASRERAGQLEYSAPERASGRSADERSLVFSIGVLLFEGLSGRHPRSKAEGPRRFAHLRSHEIHALVTHTPGIPIALRALLVRAMDPAPQQRFDSVASLRAELEWYLVAEREGAYALAPQVERAREERVRTGMERALPAVLVDSIAMVPLRPRSAELDLETAVVPRLEPRDLLPSRRAERSVPPAPRAQIDAQAAPPQVKPRRSRRSVRIRMVLVAVGLSFGSAALTALVMLLFP
jgi:hypothetical protein